MYQADASAIATSIGKRERDTLDRVRSDTSSGGSQNLSETDSAVTKKSSHDCLLGQDVCLQQGVTLSIRNDSVLIGSLDPFCDAIKACMCAYSNVL